MMLKEFFLQEFHISSLGLSVSLFTVLFELIIPYALVIIASGLLQRLSRRIITSFKFSEQIAKRIQLWGKTVINIVRFVVFLLLVFRILNWNIAAQTISIITIPFYKVGDSSISILTILLFLPVFYLAVILSKYVQRVSEQNTLPLFIDNASIRFSVSNILRYGCLLLFSLIGLSFIGINLSSLALIFGVLGIGIGFGLQTVVENFFAGLIIVSTRPIKMRDCIQLGEYQGTVVQIRLLHTVINTVSNTTIILPNKDLVNQPVYNYSHEDDRSIIIFNPVQVSYNTDLEHACSLLHALLERNPYLAADNPGVLVRVSSFDASGITLTAVCKITSAEDKFSAHSWVNMEIWRSFKEHNITIPFPQLDLHLDKGSEMPKPSS